MEIWVMNRVNWQQNTGKMNAKNRQRDKWIQRWYWGKSEDLETRISIKIATS